MCQNEVTYGQNTILEMYEYDATLDLYSEFTVFLINPHFCDIFVNFIVISCGKMTLKFTKITIYFYDLLPMKFKSQKFEKHHG